MFKKKKTPLQKLLCIREKGLLCMIFDFAKAGFYSGPNNMIALATQVLLSNYLWTVSVLPGRLMRAILQNDSRTSN